MPIKICIDAGHYGKYNRSPAVNTYYESDMTWKLSMLQKKYLEQYRDVEVIMTRNNKEIDRPLVERGTCSNGCAVLLSNHSNAVGNYVNDKVDYVLIYHLVDDKTTQCDDVSKDIAKVLAPVISNIMCTNQSFVITSRKESYDRNSDGIMNDNYYGILHGARMVNTPALILEHSFHTNTRIANWLLDDENLDRLAKAEVDALAKYFGLVKNGENSVSTPADDSNYPATPFEVKVIIDDLNIRSTPEMGENVIGVTGKGVFTIVHVCNGWGKLKSGGWIWLANPQYCIIKDTLSDSALIFKAYKVRVKVSDLNIRHNATIDSASVGLTGKGVFTIVEEKIGKIDRSGNTGIWGKLKSGAGWICLAYDCYTEKM